MGIVLDILRHGKALPAGPDGDRARPLAPEGVRELEALAERLGRERWQPVRVLASPYRRALDTAGIVARAPQTTVPVETFPALEPERDPEEVVEALAGRGITEGHVLLVGHQPLLGQLVGHLTGVETSLAPATLVRVDCPRGAGTGPGRIAAIYAPGEPGRA